MASLALERVTKIYPGGVRAVDDFSLTVADGELLVLFGPSGCGKTTLLRMIAGLEEITEGTIFIAGRVVNALPPKARDVAMVFQNHVLYPHLSVYANLAFALRLRGEPKGEIDRRVRQSAEMLDIAQLLDRRPAELSGGQRQRVALGRAIVRKPRLFLLDEPLSNLDAALREQLRREIRRLHACLGTTMVYVSHDQCEAMTLGQRIAVVRAGRLQQVADPMTLYDSPANRLVAGMLGSPAMNFFQGRIEHCDDRLLFRTEDFTLPLPDQWSARLQGCVGRPILLGIRPEHIGTASAEETADGPRIRAKVEAVETVGPESYVHLRTTADTFVARLDASHGIHAGEEFDAAVRLDEAHFFDVETEAALR